MNNYVVVVDTQYDFMMPDGILYVTGAEETIIPITKFLAELDSDKTLGVLFTYDTHTERDYTGSPESEMFPLHCELYTKGHKNVINAEVIDEDIPVFTLHKPVFNMWEGENYVKIGYAPIEPVHTFFDEAETNSNLVIVDVIGVALNFCVKQAVDGFLERGITVRLHPTMTRGIDTGKPGDLDAKILYASEIEAGKVIIVE